MVPMKSCIQLATEPTRHRLNQHTTQLEATCHIQNVNSPQAESTRHTRNVNCCSADNHVMQFLIMSYCVVWRHSVQGIELAMERLQVQVPAAPLHVTTLDKLFTCICLCSPSSINWYRLKLGAKHALHTTHQPHVCGVADSAGVWLSLGYRNGDQRHHMGPCSLGRNLSNTVVTGECNDTKALVISTSMVLEEGMTKLMTTALQTQKQAVPPRTSSNYWKSSRLHVEIAAASLQCCNKYLMKIFKSLVNTCSVKNI